MTQLRLFLFGSPRLERDDFAPAMDTRKAIALLAYLATTGQSHSRDTLAALFWPDYEQSQARANLRRTLSTLNKAIGRETLEIDRETIGLAAAAELWVDVRHFEELLQTTRSHDHPADELCPICLELLAEAQTLYQADFLAGFNLPDSPTFEEWQFFQSESLRQQITDVLAKLVDGHSRRGNFEAAIACARRWVALDPLDEMAHGWLMQVYAWSGQRSAALRQYQSLHRLLADELGVAPNKEIEAIHQAIEENRLVPPPLKGESKVTTAQKEVESPAAMLLPSSALLYNLPAPTTPFVGRESELAALTHLLSTSNCRLLTLVGPGGVGKTRLAIELAAGQKEAATDGICFVSLAALSNASFMTTAIADALNLSLPTTGNPATQLFNYLQEKELLLVLDNLEHLLVAGEQEITLLSDILQHAPQVRLIVTSRQRLHLQGEWVFEIHGLPLPPAQETSQFDHYSAVNLFIQSARRVDSNFKLTLNDQPAVARICQLVDGLPLGIELAAAWTHMLSCTEIAQEIERNLDFLAVTGPDLPERHRSLRAAFDHSWKLLSAEERRVLSRLTVFRAGFSREAAQQVSGANLAILTALVDKSLLRRIGAGRYDLHELMWQYTSAYLQAEPAALAETRRQHSRYYLALLAQNESALKGPGQPAAVAALSAEISNLRPAWQWAINHAQITDLKRAFPALLVFFEVRNWFQEGLIFFQQAVAGLQATAADPVEPPERQLCLGVMEMGQGFFLFRRGQFDSPVEAGQSTSASPRPLTLLRDSLALLESLNDQSSLAYAHLCLGIAHYTMGDFQVARRVLQTGLATSRFLGDRWLTAVHLGHLGMIAYTQGECAEADQILRESVALWREVGDIRGLVFNLSIYGMVAAKMGAVDQAEQLLKESLLISGQHNDRWGIANAFNSLAQIALAREPAHLEEADYFLSESAVIFRELGARWLLVAVLNNRGQVACRRRECIAAKNAYLGALDIAATDAIWPAAMAALVGLAEVLLTEEAPCRAAELIAQVINHPASSQPVRDKAHELWTSLGPDQRAAAGARPLEQVIAELLAAGRAS